jgi:hypothetical protein
MVIAPPSVPFHNTLGDGAGPNAQALQDEISMDGCGDFPLRAEIISHKKGVAVVR